ncbi:MAG: sigma-70 family RNA polymerase sigma factor [Gemmatimonadaceae bacterium]
MIREKMGWQSGIDAAAHVPGPYPTHNVRCDIHRTSLHMTTSPGESQPSPITDLLLDARGGDADALNRLLPHVYDHLLRISRHALAREHPDHTLGTAGLVHEAYLRLVDQSRVEYADRAHFFALAARAMRHVLVDHARRHRADKRGGGVRPVTLEDALANPSTASPDERAETLTAVDEALTRLAGIDARLGRVVECRFFGGLTEDETAEVLGITPRTVRRDWVKAKAWLYRDLTD